MAGILAFPVALLIYTCAVNPPRGQKETFGEEGAAAEDRDSFSFEDEGSRHESIEMEEEEEQQEHGAAAAQEPAREGDATAAAAAAEHNSESFVAMLKRMWADLKPLLRNRCFVVLTLATTAESLPVSALSFMVLWFQYSGLSDAATAAGYTLAALGSMMGSVVGGLMGDKLSLRFPDSGRLRLAQLAVVLLAVLSIFLLVIVPKSMVVVIAILMFLIGFWLSVPGE